MQVVGEAAILFSRGSNQSAQFGLEEHFLAIARAQLHDERDGLFGELVALGRTGFAGTGWFFLCFELRHSGRDSTPTWAKNPSPPRRRVLRQEPRGVVLPLEVIFQPACGRR